MRKELYLILELRKVKLIFTIIEGGKIDLFFAEKSNSPS
jgi:hypothetical protein